MAHFESGDCAASLRDQTEAIEIAEAGALRPEGTFAYTNSLVLPAAYLNRGIVYYWQKDLRRATDDFNDSVSIDPLNAEAYNYRGLAEYELFDDVAALRNFDQAIQLDPSQAKFFFLRAIVKTSLGLDAEAQPDIANAVQMGISQSSIEDELERAKRRR